MWELQCGRRTEAIPDLGSSLSVRRAVTGEAGRYMVLADLDPTTLGQVRKPRAVTDVQYLVDVTPLCIPGFSGLWRYPTWSNYTSSTISIVTDARCVIE